MASVPFGRKVELPLGLWQLGFSLVELMVSIFIGLLVTAALLGLYVNTVRTNAEIARTNSQIENGRFAIQFLSSDIAHAGFWGGYVPKFDNLSHSTTPTDAPNGIPEIYAAFNTTNWTSGYKNSLIGIPIQTYDSAPGCADPGDGCTDERVVNLAGNSDVLVVRHAETCLPGTANCEDDTAGALYFQAGYCATDASEYQLETTGLNLRARDCATVVGKRKFVSNIYYVRNYSVSPGDNIPTLVRSQFDLAGGTLAHQPAVPLVEGIEAFRVELGVDSLSDNDTDITAGSPALYTQAITWSNNDNLTSPTNRGDGVPDGAFVHCSTSTPCNHVQLTHVVAVRVHLLARTNATTPGHVDAKTYRLGAATLGPYNDGYKRHVFTTTIRLTNVSGRRETP